LKHSDKIRIFHALHEGMLVRRGVVITDIIARDRAANMADAIAPLIDDLVTEALREAARGEVVTGTIERKDQ
jgi:hypothetical protein